MSGFGGFGGFGQQNNNNQQQQSTGFGGFGATNNTNTGFGSTGTSGFGTNTNTGGGLFGGANNSSSTGGFGTSGGGFGTQNSGFGAKPGGFGTTASTGGGLFGGGNTTTTPSTGFGGFGGGSTQASTGFGAGNTGGSLFGAKPAATTSAFGGANSTPSTFGGFGGGSTTTSAFGASALGATGDCQGTGSVPFQATVEKEPNTTSNQQNSFQSICFQQPYQKWSPEELRLADYAQGRRYGNASGQAGAFGVNTGFGNTNTGASTGFGGFGTTNNNTSTTPASNLFGGSSTATSSPFGAAQPATTGFGSNNTTSLFGQKPAATGGLFGSGNQNSGTGLFGNSNNNTTGGFGAAPAAGGFGSTPTNTSGGLFGSNNNNAAKPGGFSFGQQPAASTGTGFGSTPATGGFGSGGLFGNNTTSASTASPFGGTQQPAAASNPFGSFGNNNQQQQQNTGSLFGGNNNQPKPATGGLFGGANTNASGGLFGSAPQQPATNSLFGGTANNTQQNTGGLFGNQNKPATTGTGLFGSGNTTQTNTGTGLFGGSFGQNNNQNQTQQNTTSLFGQKPATGGLFGGGQTQQQSGGMFGNNNTQQSGGGLFSNLNSSQQQQPQQQNSLFGGGNSMFAGSQQGQPTPQSLTTSINDSSAFGTPSMFQDLGNGPVNNPGPLATPLSSVNKQKRPAALPLYKLNSASSSRFATPQKKGFGFSYSNYGSPSSVSSTSSTPGTFSNSLLGGLTQQRGLSKSMSASSLRNSFNNETSLLAPGAFSASPATRQYGSTGSMKKLVINRGIRGDLFSPPPQAQQASVTGKTGGILKKRVSFDGNSMSSGPQNMTSPLKQVTNNATPSAEELGFIRPRPSAPKTNGVESQAPEMEHVKGNELAIVHEEESSNSAASVVQPKPISHEDLAADQYWMSPSKEEILAMNRTQRAKVSGFKVGRKGVGEVNFMVPVDLTNINPDEVMDNIVVFATRSCTVYPNIAQKPPMGKGLNVPSIISLNNSWPRKKDKRTISGEKSGPRFEKHVQRLKQVPDTKFIDYDKDTGVWTFQVEHFTTYGLEYEDDEETDGDVMSQFDQSELSAPPDTPTPQNRTPRSAQYDESFASTQLSRTESDPEDTFQFRRKKILPGAFDDQVTYEDDEMEEEYDEQDQQSFLDERSVGSHSENGIDEPMDHDDVFQDDESVSIVDQEMAGSFPQAGNTAEQDGDSQNEDEMDMVGQTPGALVRARMRANAGRTPSKKFAAGDDWTSMLKTTISPQKQDRAFLKSLIDVDGDSPTKASNQDTPAARSKFASDTRGFATSIDLMNSLFGQTKSPMKATKAPAKQKGFEWPYEKRPKTADSDMSDMGESDRAFHESMKPSWGPDGTLIYAAPANPKQYGRSSRRVREKDGILANQKGGIVSESRDVRFAKFSNENAGDVLNKHKSMTAIDLKNGVPFARLTQGYLFTEFCNNSNARDPAAMHEKLVWELASILFDDIAIPAELEHLPNATDRLRKDKLSAFWQKMVDQASSQHVAMARTPEEKTIAALAGHRVPDACGFLINSKNFHLATLVALIGVKDSMRKDIREQLKEWNKSKVLAEFSQPIRAIYEILSGNVCLCDGSKGAPIEDRIESFIISKRFGLDWRQAFGLRLWYATLSTDNLQSAVMKFEEDLEKREETAFPQAWYVEQKIPTLWEDSHLEQREDLLWGLLKLYSLDDADLEAILRPENSQLSPLDARLSWQLSRALTTLGPFITYGEDAEAKADRLSLSFAAQLVNEGAWLDAIFILLHLHNPEARAKSIQDHLAQNAGRIGSEDSLPFITMTQTYMIPATWIWEAKALFMRSVKKDPIAEVECLIHAGSFDEAHRTFAKEVAPKAIIERDYDTLSALLEGFHGKEDAISEWRLGGEIYSDFLILLGSQKKASGVSAVVQERLLAGLPAMVEETRHPAFMETVAVEIISNTLAKVVVDLGKRGKDADLSKVLSLPLTEDRYLRHTVDLSIGHYKSIMASGR